MGKAGKFRPAAVARVPDYGNQECGKPLISRPSAGYKDGHSTEEVPMLASDIDHLRCVDCGASLRIVEVKDDDGVIEEGVLECVQCARHYPVIDSVGIFFRRGVLDDFIHPAEVAAIRARGWLRCLEGGSSTDEQHLRQLAVAENWAYQWCELTEGWQREDFEKAGYLGADAFWSFIPVPRELLRDRLVLVTAGGLGREAYHLAKAGPARLFVNEIGVEIYKVKDLLPDAGRRLVLLRSDMMALPLAEGLVDVAICDHALQHLPDHKGAYARLAKATRPGGTVAVCVYSHENNWVMTGFIDPAKAIFHRLPLKAQRLAALPFAAVLYAVIHGLYRPAGALCRRLAARLPLFEHMMMWSRQPFSLVWLQCFDLIQAPVSHHFRRAEMEALAAEQGLMIRTLVNTNGTLWTMVAEVPAAAQ